MHYSYGGQVKFVRYTDSDWARDRDEQKFTSGYAYFLGLGPIAWLSKSSKKQSTISLSSNDIEYRDVVTARQEVLWIQTLLEELGVHQERSTSLQCDKQGTIQIVHHPH